MNYLIIGAGRMSMGVVSDLLHFTDAQRIWLTDVSQAALDTFSAHFKDERIESYLIAADDKEKIWPLMQNADGVLSAVPYDYNFDLTQWAIEAKCHFVDLGGNNTVVNRQFELDARAKAAGVGIIPDCGLAPGMVSGVAAYYMSHFDTVDTLEIRVGGLPVHPQPPLNYMLVFSVHGLTNEYIEPAVILKDGAITTVPSMTEVEELHFPAPFEHLEAFYTSGGTSTLPKTFAGKIKTLNYKTIRYPGHCQLFKAMIDLDFTSHDEIILDGKKFKRRDVFEALLHGPLTYPGDDVVLIQIALKGQQGTDQVAEVYQAIEYGDDQGLTAMMRTTAFPAAITLEMLVDGVISEAGVLRQELAIPAAEFMDALEKRNITFKRRIT
jgi:lysine 6-dehydrogenase